MDIFKHIRKSELKAFSLPIYDNYGVGHRFTHGEDSYLTQAQFCNHSKFAKFRSIKFDITSWVGISGGAKHYYGKITVRIENHVEGTKNTTSSGAIDKYRPKEASDIEFELVRPVTQEEIDNDNKWDRTWECYHVGDDTTRFDTPEELIELGKKLVKKMFVGKWALVITTCYGRRDDIIKLSDL